MGPQGAREGNFCGWGSRSTRGWRGDLLEGVRGGGAAGTRAARAGDSSFGPELQGASEDSAEPPTAPFPSPTPPQPQSTAQLRQRSKQTQLQGPPPASRGLPHRAPRSLPRNPCGPATSIHRPRGTPQCTRRRLPFPASRSRRGRLGDADTRGAPRSPPPTPERQSRGTNRNSPTSLGGGLGRSLQRRRRRQHCRVVPERPPPAPPDARRGSRASAGSAASASAAPAPCPARGGSAPPAPPPSALPAGLRRLALGCKRELSCHRPDQRTERVGAGGRARLPAVPPSPAAPPPPTPPLYLSGRSVRLSVCLSGIANHLRGEELPTLPRALPRPCPLGPNLSGDLDVVLSTRECGT